MAFKEYIYKELEYDETNDTCKVTVEVVDDAEGSEENTFIIGSKHFKGKNLNVAARDALIKSLVKKEVGHIHKNMTDRKARESAVSTVSKIPMFAKGTSI